MQQYEEGIKEYFRRLASIPTSTQFIKWLF